MPEYPTTTSKVSDAVREVVRLRAYEHAGDLPTLKADLGSLATLDKRDEKKQIFTIIICIVGFICLIVFAEHLKGLLLIGAIVAVIALLIFILKSGAHFSVPDERYLVASKLLDMLARDTGDDATYSVKIDFERVNAKRNFIRDVFGGRLYGSRWLVLKGRFLDGTAFQFSVTELLKIKHRKGKRRPKGYKLDLLMTLNDKRYAAAQDLIAAPAKFIKLPSRCQLKALNMKRKHFRISVRAPMSYGTPAQTVDELYVAAISMFLSSYHVLNLAKKVSRLEHKGEQS